MHADRVRGAPIFRALLRGLLISHHVQSQFHFQFNLLSTNKTMCLESKILRDLHLTQVIEAAPDAEAGHPRHSILTDCMGDGDKSRKLYFTSAAWLSCLSTSDGVMAFTGGEWQNWFCSFLGVAFHADVQSPSHALTRTDTQTFPTDSSGDQSCCPSP